MRRREWNRCTDPEAMLRAVWIPATFPLDQPVPLSPRQERFRTLVEADRKLCVRRLRIFTLSAVEPTLRRVDQAACYAAAEVGWRLAEGVSSREEIDACSEQLHAAWEDGFNATRDYLEAPPELWALPRLVNVLALLLSEPWGAARQVIVPISLVHPGEPVPLLSREETQNCCWLLREIFGDRGGLLVSPMWEEAWRTETAVALARHIYESRDFSAMPILADALQDAGCDNVDVLGHCRGPGPHLRGCWVVDTVLGK